MVDGLQPKNLQTTSLPSRANAGQVVSLGPAPARGPQADSHVRLNRGSKPFSNVLP